VPDVQPRHQNEEAGTQGAQIVAEGVLLASASRPSWLYEGLMLSSALRIRELWRKCTKPTGRRLDL
jgi:hypothetical protein